MKYKKYNPVESDTREEILLFLAINKIKHWKNGVFHGYFTPFGSNKKRAVQTGVKGLSDYCCFAPDKSGRTIYIELKRKKGGVQSENQKSFEKECIKNNVTYVLVTSWIDLWEYFYNVLEIKLRKLEK